jgi:hypothetical protein
VPADCYWCGVSAVREVELEPPVFETLTAPQTLPDGTTRPKGFKVMKRRAIKAWVCQTHSEMVDRNRREQEERKAAHQAMLKQRREEKKKRQQTTSSRRAA